MAKARAGKQSAKKKKWVKIVSPKFLGERELGETYLEEVSSAMGKTVSINLMKVTGDIKTQNCTVKFVVYETKDGLLRTKIVSYTYLPSSIKRMVRRRMNRVDDSIVVRTKDNVRIRIKPMLLTHGKASKSIEYALRAGMKQELISRIKKMNYEELFSSVIKNNIQMDNQLEKTLQLIQIDIDLIYLCLLLRKPQNYKQSYHHFQYCELMLQSLVLFH